MAEEKKQTKSSTLHFRVTADIVDRLRRAAGIAGIKEPNDNRIALRVIEKSVGKAGLLPLMDQPYESLRQCWYRVQADGLLSFEEIQLVSHFVRQAYIYSNRYRATVEREPLAEVVLAWLSLYAGYERQLAETKRYFLSNLPNHATGDDVVAIVRQWVDDLEPRVGVLGAEIASRNLDVALDRLQTIDINVGDINARLKPHMRSLLMVAFRGCWLAEDMPSRQVTPLEATGTAFSSVGMNRFDFFPKWRSDDERVEFSLLEGPTGVTGMLFFFLNRDHKGVATSFTFAFNNPVELWEFAEDAALRADSTESAIDKGLAYVLLTNTFKDGAGKPDTSHALRIRGQAELTFTHEQFQVVNALMQKGLSDPRVKAGMADLSYVYGKI